jgi:hypothetical protein
MSASSDVRSSASVVEPQAQPFGSVHFTAQLTQLSPHAHSGQIMQQPVEPSLQLARSAVRAAGNNQTANDQSTRRRSVTDNVTDEP